MKYDKWARHGFKMKKANYLLVLVTFMFATSAYAQKVEAEEGILHGTHVDSLAPGFSGKGYVTGFDQEHDAVDMTIVLDTSGVYRLSLRYAASGYKENGIIINGVSAGKVKFLPTKGFEMTEFGLVYLSRGSNTIKIVKEWGFFDLDYIQIEPSQANDFLEVGEQLADPNATNEVKVLYRFLRDYYGHRIISGQQGGSTEIAYIKSKTGKQPALWGFDLMDYSPSRVARGTSSTEIEAAIDWRQDEGGVVTFSWHWNAPKDLIDTVGAEWWRGFYTSATIFDVSIAMNDSSSEEYQLIVRDIDAIAEELKLLADAKVPILWRPLHEAEGGWFWWGAKGPEACKWLWKLMYQRLTAHHGLHNMLWVWTGTDSPMASDWYPGDDVVDVVGADIYLNAANYSTNFTSFDRMVGIHSGKKIIALLETGTIPDPDHLDVQKAAWSWFMVWGGDFITDGVKNDVNHLTKVYNHPYVITLDELPDFGNYESPDFSEDNLVMNLEAEKSVVIYPNPVTEAVSVSFEDNRDVEEVHIYTIGGDRVSSMVPLKGGAVDIDLSDYPKGLYLIRIVGDRQTRTFKVSKQ